MTSEELAALKKRLKELNDNCPIIDAKILTVVRDLLATVEEQQSEIDHRDKVIHDLTEESTAFRLGVEEGRGGILLALKTFPGDGNEWRILGKQGVFDIIANECRDMYENRPPPSRHQQECERLMAENEALKKEVERLTRPPQINRSVTIGRGGNEAHP